jgi:hypothetical protein
VLLIGSFVIAPGLVASVVIAGIVAVLAVVFGRGVAIFVRGWRSPAATGVIDDEQSVSAD